jgi:hypothetical protein
MNFLQKTYFHPVLRQGNQDYTDSSYFIVQFAESVNSSALGDEVSVQVNFELKNSKIEMLIRTEEAKIVLVLNCVDTMKKFVFDIVESGQNFKIPVGSVIGNLTCQVLVVANTRVDFFAPSGVNSEFGSLEFSLHEGSPLAISQLQSFLIQPRKIRLFQMIRVQKSEALHPDTYEFILSASSITITMGKRAFEYWTLLRMDSKSSSHLFTSIYKDALVEALKSILEDDGIKEYLWAQKLLTFIEDKSILESDRPDLQRINQEVCKMLAAKGIERYLSHAQSD